LAVGLIHLAAFLVGVLVLVVMGLLIMVRSVIVEVLGVAALLSWQARLARRLIILLAAR
jgi:hypothetical protein